MKHKTTFIIIGIIVIVGIGYFIFLKTDKKTLEKEHENFIRSALSNSQVLTSSQASKNKTIQEVGKLTGIPKDSDVIIGEIDNLDVLKKKYPFLGRAFKGDTIIAYPAQTIIYDTKTHVIRDISSISVREL